MSAPEGVPDVAAIRARWRNYGQISVDVDALLDALDRAEASLSDLHSANRVATAKLATAQDLLRAAEARADAAEKALRDLLPALRSVKGHLEADLAEYGPDTVGLAGALATVDLAMFKADAALAPTVGEGEIVQQVATLMESLNKVATAERDEWREKAQRAQRTLMDYVPLVFHRDVVARVQSDCDTARKELAEARRLLAEAADWMADDGCDCGQPGFDIPCVLCRVRAFLAAPQVAPEAPAQEAACPKHPAVGRSHCRHCVPAPPVETRHESARPTEPVCPKCHLTADMGCGETPECTLPPACKCGGRTYCICAPTVARETEEPRPCIGCKEGWPVHGRAPYRTHSYPEGYKGMRVGINYCTAEAK